MRNDVPARLGPTTDFGAPLNPSERFLFDLARVLNGHGVECRSASAPAADRTGGVALDLRRESRRQMRLDLGAGGPSPAPSRPCSDR